MDKIVAHPISFFNQHGFQWTFSKSEIFESFQRESSVRFPWISVIENESLFFTQCPESVSKIVGSSRQVLSTEELFSQAIIVDCHHWKTTQVDTNYLTVVPASTKKKIIRSLGGLITRSVSGKNPHASHFSKSQIFVQKFNFDKHPNNHNIITSFSPKKSTIFSGNQSWTFGQKVKISSSVIK